MAAGTPRWVERGLEQWAVPMDASGFPPRLDLFKGMAVHLAQKSADEEDDSSLAILDRNWL